MARRRGQAGCKQLLRDRDGYLSLEEEEGAGYGSCPEGDDGVKGKKAGGETNGFPKIKADGSSMQAGRGPLGLSLGAKTIEVLIREEPSRSPPNLAIIAGEITVNTGRRG